MKKITVEICAEGFTGLSAENIEKALNHYFGSPSLHVSFSVVDAQQSEQGEKACEHKWSLLTKEGLKCISCGHIKPLN